MDTQAHRVGVIATPKAAVVVVPVIRIRHPPHHRQKVATIVVPAGALAMEVVVVAEVVESLLQRVLQYLSLPL